MRHDTLTTPTYDQATIDRAIARARRERSRMVLAALRSLVRAITPAGRTVRGHKTA